MRCHGSLRLSTTAVCVALGVDVEGCARRECRIAPGRRARRVRGLREKHGAGEASPRQPGEGEHAQPRAASMRVTHRPSAARHGGRTFAGDLSRPRLSARWGGGEVSRADDVSRSGDDADGAKSRRDERPSTGTCTPRDRGFTRQEAPGDGKPQATRSLGRRDVSEGPETGRSAGKT